MNRRTLTTMLLAAAALLGQGTARAAPDAFAGKQIRMVIGFVPGGITDVLARMICDGLGKSLSASCFVDNLPGANGTIAETQFVKARPDGLTLLMTLSSHVTNLLIYENLPYGLHDFQPVSMVATSPLVLVSNGQFAPNSLQELIALSKRGQVTFASPGAGSTQHLAIELFGSMAGTQLTHIAYKGGGPALTDVLGGHVNLALITPSTGLTYLKEGKLKAFAVTPAHRLDVLPGVPTVAEAGVPGYEDDVWFGVLAPAGTPQPIVERLNAAMVELFRKPETNRTLTELGAVPAGSTPEAFGALMEADFRKWGPVVRRIGIKAQ